MNNESNHKHLEDDVTAFFAASSTEQDPLLTILRVHLLTERYIERFIVAYLPRGDKIADAGFSYQQKLTIAESFDLIPDKLIQCLKNLNKFRNKCAHEYGKEISKEDIEMIGRSLGVSELSRIRKTPNSTSNSKYLAKILESVCAQILLRVHEIESPEED